MMPRYLDEEKIKHTVNEYIDRTGSDVFTREHIFDFLFETETEDVQEVEYGEWKLKFPRRTGRNATFKCSRCGKLCSSYYNDVGVWKYCPHCGARMDGDKR